MTETPISLRKFGAKRAATSAVMAGLVNALVIHLSLSGMSEVPIFALVAEHWKQSLIGALVPRALLISLLVTFMTVWATVKSSKARKVYPPIKPGASWVGRTLKVGLGRSVISFMVVVAIALVLRLLVPAYTNVPSGWVTVFVALFAAAIAYVMSWTAVLRIAERVEDGTSQIS